MPDDRTTGSGGAEPTPTGSSGATAEAGAEAVRNRGLLLLVGIAATIVVVAGIRQSSSLIGSVLLATVLIVTVLPLGQWAIRHRWPSWAAASLVVVAGYTILLLLIGGVVLSIGRLVTTLPRYQPRLNALLDDLLHRLSRAGIQTGSLQDALNKIDIGSMVNLLQSLLSSVLNVLTTLAFLAALLIFMAADALGLSRRITELHRVKPTALVALTEFARGTRRYLLVSAIFGGIVAIFDTGALWLLAIPLPLTWGLLSFLTNFIPNVGFVLGLVPPALLALLDQGWQRMLAVIVVYSVLNILIQTLIQPRYVGDSVGLNATATFLALAFWGSILGALGALLAVPATLLVRAVFVDGHPNARWVMLLFGTHMARRKDAEPAATAAGDG